MTIAIGIITGSSIRWETAQSLDMARTAGIFDGELIVKTGVYLGDNRNRVVRHFLEHSDADKLLFVDSDVSFMPADIARLDADDLDVVSGVYYNIFDGTMKPVMAFGELGCSDEPLLQVDATGAGFLMIRRALLEKMAERYPFPAEWFATTVRDGVFLGEDFEFCARLKDLGIPLFADLRVQISHYKSIRLAASSAVPSPYDP